MKKSIVLPYNSQSISIIMALSDDEPSVVMDKISNAYTESLVSVQEKNSMSILGYDRSQWDIMQEKIKQITEDIADKELSRDEKILKIYGWVKPKNRAHVSIPFGMQQDEYGYASTIQTIIDQPDLYMKMLSFD